VADSNELTDVDDIALIASTESKMNELVAQLHHGAARSVGMRINVTQTEVRKICDDASPMNVTIDGGPHNCVHSFRYLGAEDCNSDVL